jgi:PelA/Pel-15E family pectate lyase
MINPLANKWVVGKAAIPGFWAKQREVWYMVVLVFLIPGCGFSPPASVAQQMTDVIAERMLLYQRENGGWPQPGGDAINYDKELSPEQQQVLLRDKPKLDATIDDRATTREINYLVTAYQKTHNDAYRQAAGRGVGYLLKAQQANGGWAQFYPDSSGYRKQITYNDNAMINVLWVMKYTAQGTLGFGELDKALAPLAQRAVERGIACIVNTQYIQKGTLTAWCAQHDRRTLLPTHARKFELPSISGSESVGILRFLMSQDNPSPEVKRAVKAAVTWLDSVRLTGIAVKTITDQTGAKDVIVVADPTSTLWARFYELETNRPFFCGRDGVKKYDLAEVEQERRAGYAWYGTWPAKLLEKEYPAWAKKWGV